MNPNQKYVLAIDQGTTGTTALLFDESLNIAGKFTVEFPQHFPQPGWVEHDLNEIWDSVLKAVKGALSAAKASSKSIAAIGITNQRETTCLWWRDAQPLRRAIVWQDRRTASECEKLRKKGLSKKIQMKTGLVLDPYFSATKLQWILKNTPGAMTAAKSGKLLFGTIDSFVLYKLTGEHRTDVTNASRTLLMDIRKCTWDADLMKLFGVPKQMLPEIFPSAVEYGRTKGFLDIPDGTPVSGMIGDQQSALFGQACFEKGSAKCTYGTGAFAVLNTGDKPVFSKSQMLTTVAWKLGNKTTYALEGSAFIAGAAVQWLRDGLQLFGRSAEIEKLAESVDDAGGVLFVPALSGMGAPHWLPHATGLLTGVTRGTTKAHVARATLEGIAYQVSELFSAMAKDMGKRPLELKVDGGASENNLLMQFQADLIGCKVVRCSIVETTALGAGLQAGLAIGMWKDLADIKKRWTTSRTFTPQMAAKEKTAKLLRWDRAMEAVNLLAN